jgi:hypothetical protein
VIACNGRTGMSALRTRLALACGVFAIFRPQAYEYEH